MRQELEGVVRERDELRGRLEESVQQVAKMMPVKDGDDDDDDDDSVGGGRSHSNDVNDENHCGSLTTEVMVLQAKGAMEATADRDLQLKAPLAPPLGWSCRPLPCYPDVPLNLDCECLTIKL